MGLFNFLWSSGETKFTPSGIGEDYSVMRRGEVCGKIYKTFGVALTPDDDVYIAVSEKWFNKNIVSFVEYEYKRKKKRYGIGSWRSEKGDCDDRARSLRSSIVDAYNAHTRFQTKLPGFAVFQPTLEFSDNTSEPHDVVMVIFKGDVFKFYEIDKNGNVRPYVINWNITKLRGIK